MGHLTQVLDAHNLAYRYLDFTEAGVLDSQLWMDISQGKDLEALIVLGGAMNVDQTKRYPFLLDERSLLQKTIADNVPVFGICLGSQLIARSLGARVVKNPVKEIGWYPVELLDTGRQDPVVSGLANFPQQFQWHEDRFDLPPGATWLARSVACDQQAYCIGKSVYGVQFHPEMTEPVIEEWLAESSTLPEARKNEIRNETSQYLSAYQTTSQEMLDRFLSLNSL